VDSNDTYDITLKKGRFDQKDMDRFLRIKECPFTKKNKKGKTYTSDLKKRILRMDRVDPKRLVICLSNEGGGKIRPADVMKTVFHLEDDGVKTARVMKTFGGRRDTRDEPE
jgi:hypothetical protein